jgi:BirA family biotin operon repressor/biotin-[acetyl-CoA-carboxylase] ligase
MPEPGGKSGTRLRGREEGGAPRVVDGGAGPDRDAALVGLLRDAGGVSGAEIGRRLGLTRAAVWKHVERLRVRGYAIEGTPSRGYRLLACPDRLSAAELGPHLRSAVLGRVVHYEEETGSTNVVARGLARAGAAEGTVVVAETQTAGRGRLGRAWFSPPGSNLYLSVVLRPDIPPARAPQLALVAGSAVAAAIEAEGGVRPALKWPNDVLLDGRKVAGILTEMDSEADRVGFVVLGIGVNLNVSACELADALGDTATSVAAATGHGVDRARFTGRLLGELERRYRRVLDEGFAAGLRAEWEGYSALTGREVTVTGPDGDRRGRVIGVDGEGALCLAPEGGGVMRVLAGDVTLLDGYVRAAPRGSRNRAGTAAPGGESGRRTRGR